MKITTTLSISFLLSASYLPTAMAQTVSGTLGSPSATTTIQGNQIPAVPPKFGGVIKDVRSCRRVRRPQIRFLIDRNPNHARNRQPAGNPRKESDRWRVERWLGRGVGVTTVR